MVGIILAYVAGHVLQTIAHSAIPSSFIEGRHPSSVFLDKKNKTFTEGFKKRLAKQVYTAFKFDVYADLDLDVSGEAADEASAAQARKTQKAIDQVRSDAFFLCRSALIKSKTVVYAEQFEGLYALMRGLSAAFGMGVVYYLGWATSGLLQPIKTFRFVPPSVWSWPLSGMLTLVALLIAVSALINANRKRAKTVMIGSLLLAAFATGYYLGLSSVRASEHRGQLIAAAVLSFFAAERCYAGYKAFAQEFAKAVYRDFSNYEKPAGE